MELSLRTKSAPDYLSGVVYAPTARKIPSGGRVYQIVEILHPSRLRIDKRGRFGRRRIKGVAADYLAEAVHARGVRIPSRRGQVPKVCQHAGFDVVQEAVRGYRRFGKADCEPTVAHSVYLALMPPSVPISVIEPVDML